MTNQITSNRSSATLNHRNTSHTILFFFLPGARAVSTQGPDDKAGRPPRGASLTGLTTCKPHNTRLLHFAPLSLGVARTPPRSNLPFLRASSDGSGFLNIRWAHNGVVTIGPYCTGSTPQGIVGQTGQLGSP
jgi:hypothetical protein